MKRIKESIGYLLLGLVFVVAPLYGSQSDDVLVQSFSTFFLAVYVVFGFICLILWLFDDRF